MDKPKPIRIYPPSGGFFQEALDFIDAVDWTEPWIQAIIAAHLFIIGFVIITKNHTTIQSIALFFLLFIARLAEWLNSLGASHWQKFSRQNYFDERGVFMGVVVAGPLLLVSLFIVINLLLHASSLLIKVKRKEALQQAKKKKKE